MLYGKIFRSTVAHGRITRIDVERGARARRRASRRHHRRRAQGRAQPVLRPGLPRPADPRRRQGALCRRAGRGGARHRSACRGGSGAADRGRVRGAAGGVRRGRGHDLAGDRARRAQARRHVSRPQASAGHDATPTSRSTSICGAATSAAAFAEADHVFEHTFRTQQVLHLPLEPFVSIAEPTDTGLTIHTASQSPSFVRIEIARLLGWPENKVRVKVPYLGGGFGAKLYIKLEALVAALRAARAPAGEDLAHHGGAVLHAHQARQHVPHQERRSRTAASRRANARCGGTAAPMRISARASRRNRASRRPAPTTSRTSRSIPIRSTPTCRRPARCAASASRSWCGPTRATPT